MLTSQLSPREIKSSAPKLCKLVLSPSTPWQSWNLMLSQYSNAGLPDYCIAVGTPFETSANWNDKNSILNQTNSFLCPSAICYLLVLLASTINIKKADGQVQEFRQGVFWGQSHPNRSTKYVGSESEGLCIMFKSSADSGQHQVLIRGAWECRTRCQLGQVWVYV